jgi:hypothetical protein
MWLAIGASVAAYDLLCPQGEQLSQRVDEWLERPTTRYVAMAGIAATALHLANILDPRVDPYHYAFELRRVTRNAIE